VGAVCVDGECETDGAQTFVVFALYAAHSVTKGEDVECLDFRSDRNLVGNPAAIQYLTKRTITTEAGE